MENQELNQVSTTIEAKEAPVGDVSQGKKRLLVLLGVLAIVIVLAVLTYAAKLSLPLVGQEAVMPTPLPSSVPRNPEAEINKDIQRASDLDLDKELKAIDEQIKGL